MEHLLREGLDFLLSLLHLPGFLTHGLPRTVSGTQPAVRGAYVSVREIHPRAGAAYTHTHTHTWACPGPLALGPSGSSAVEAGSGSDKGRQAGREGGETARRYPAPPANTHTHFHRPPPRLSLAHTHAHTRAPHTTFTPASCEAGESAPLRQCVWGGKSAVFLLMFLFISGVRKKRMRRK